MSTRIKHPGLSRNAIATALLAAFWVLGAESGQAQMVQYGEQLAGYKDMNEGGVKLQDRVFPTVSAKSRVNFALARDEVVDARAITRPDGTLELPDGSQNVVIRTDYTNVHRDPNGVIRVASPTIDGNVNGNVTLYVDGDGVRNITVLNNPR